MATEIPLIGMCAAYIIGVTIFLVTREKGLGRDRRLSLLAYLVFAASASVAGWVSYKIVYAPAPVAEADLAPVDKGGKTLEVTIPTGDYELVVHGQMDVVRSRVRGRGEYSVEMRENGKLIQAFDGTLDQHVETRRVMKKGVTQIEVKHLEGRHDLKPEYAGKKVSITVTQEAGNLKGPMHVMVIHSPPSDPLVLIVGCILSLIGACVDRRVKEGAKSYVGIGAAFYVMFALLVLQSSHPLEPLHLLAVVPMSLLLGAAGGGIFRVLVKPFVKPLPGSVPASGK